MEDRCYGGQGPFWAAIKYDYDYDYHDSDEKMEMALSLEGLLSVFEDRDTYQSRRKLE